MAALPRWLKSFLGNLLLLVVSVGVAYFAGELAFFRFVVPELSLNLRAHLPETAEVLLQNSKSGAVPRDYVAILGDSYAEGLGEWALAGAGDRAKPYHSANVIHERTGRDVASFGKGGNGSVQALVVRPARILAGNRCIVFPDIEDPKQIVVYFYEGNDLHDNLNVLEILRQRGFHGDIPAAVEFVAERYGAAAGRKCHAHFWETVVRMARFIYRDHPEGHDLFRMPAPSGNSVVVGGRVVDVPAGLQGPSLELEDEEIVRAVALYDRSLAWLRRRFPQSPVTVAYIPAPLSVYRLAGDTVRIHSLAQRRSEFPAVRVGRNSDLTCRLVREVTLRHGAGFLDTRPALRAAASAEVIHGPTDWYHFNETGYRLLGTLVSERLKNPAAADPCADPPAPDSNVSTTQARNPG